MIVAMKRVMQFFEINFHILVNFCKFTFFFSTYQVHLYVNVYIHAHLDYLARPAYRYSSRIR
jgi:hypothetical protein